MFPISKSLALTLRTRPNQRVPGTGKMLAAIRRVIIDMNETKRGTRSCKTINRNHDDDGGTTKYPGRPWTPGSILLSRDSDHVCGVLRLQLESDTIIERYKGPLE